jgi:hypothetical protein
MRALRRLVLLVVLVATAVTLLRRRRPLPSGDVPTWPPLDVVVRAAPDLEPLPPVGALSAADLEPVDVVVHPIDMAGAPPALHTSAVWVEPVGGSCPVGHPVKVNVGSGIFHLPGGRSYARTKPERCYATPEDAEADGFRRAKL